VPGRDAVFGRLRACAPGKGNTCCVGCDGKANDWDDAEGIDAETTAESGGSVVRACDSEPPEVGGRLVLDPGQVDSVKPRLNMEVKGRKDCWVVEEALDDEGARKDQPGSRKERLFVGREAGRSMLEVWMRQVEPW
jgi:hypothetical protein